MNTVWLIIWVTIKGSTTMAQAPILEGAAACEAAAAAANGIGTAVCGTEANAAFSITDGGCTLVSRDGRTDFYVCNRE